MWYAFPDLKFEIISSPFFAEATARRIAYGRLLRTVANSVLDFTFANSARQSIRSAWPCTRLTATACRTYAYAGIGLYPLDKSDQADEWNDHEFAPTPVVGRTTTALWREFGETRTHMHGHPSE
jgi:hypothetical protein